MRVLTYKDLDLRKVKAAFAKVRAYLEADDFRSADVKKLAPGKFWRAKLGRSDRLLLQFARCGGQTVCLVLEVIENHAYEKSRFLRGIPVDESKIEAEPVGAPEQEDHAVLEAAALRWLHPTRSEFELLDRPIVFDDAQEAVRRLVPPVVVVGSAGSGKTAVTLAKMREATGGVLYVTHSAYLAQSARAIYEAHGFENPHQEASFLSYREFVETLRVPKGREVTYPAFAGWFERHRAAARSSLGEVDAHALYEEFRGVIGASAAGPLDLPTYLALGARQSLFAEQARTAAHALFERYRQWLRDTGLFDLNLVAQEWRALATPTYDFVVIDEVQDLTNVQLALVLATLKTPGQFLLCGDSNQIVHPNFFSWAAVRSLFWHGVVGMDSQRQELSVLQANFRNTRTVTELANALLKIKQARFGSIDKESNFLVECASMEEGSAQLLDVRSAGVKELNTRTRTSAQYAVVVLRDEDKPRAREYFSTPLVFAVHEAKGLEYPHVILFELISGQRAAYTEVCEGVRPEDLDVQTLAYNRARDKADKSLEIYKFYVNALYVAITRAVQSLVLVESDLRHPLFALLGLQAGTAPLSAPVARASTREEWAQEARKLALQGKVEQAQAIQDTFLRSQEVPWKPWTQTLVQELLPKVLNPADPSNKVRQMVYDYALWHGQHMWIRRLYKEAHFAPAQPIWQAWEAFGRNTSAPQVQTLRKRHLQPYTAHNFKDILRQCDQYGVDHKTVVGATPLAMAVLAGNLPLVDALLERGANPALRNEFGHTPWMEALCQAMDDLQYAKQSLGLLFDRIAPPVLDVQTDERYHPLHHAQAEYWVLSLMLAGFKTLCSDAMGRRDYPYYKYAQGFFAALFAKVFDTLPLHIWQARRRKGTYINAVLARAERDSTYIPARKLWVRTQVGHYLPNPEMQLRWHDGTTQEPVWKAVMEVLGAEWVSEGTKGRLLS
ncbi:AAA family ATPase [Candidatus Symbiobacter mobilis]|uniref:Ankyrin n=1 Tax=Candidatus Symbiobacter mobilis CR TaxID=946483 RepID=U5NA79_9BURK|nr:AAA family ATPase [Candidatus Symbiobacter mobilis]AGX88446.1 ankyrin [Candidatus Symbiobacter mobilis CR]